MRLVYLVLMSLAPVAARGAYLPYERIPTDSPVYRDLERLASTYAHAPRFLSSRPLARGAVLAYLHELEAEHPDASDDPAFRRVAWHVDAEAEGASRPFLARSGDDGERIEVSPYISLAYSDDPRNQPDINRDYRGGVAASAGLDSSSVVVANWFAGTASQGGRGTPNFGTLNAWVEGVDFNSWLEEAYLDFPISKLRITAGHTWLRWGPGREGTLALSDAAPALDLARAEADAFGALRYQWFVSLLDPGPQTYLAGQRLQWSPSGRLSLGFTEMARFDGTSQAPLYMIPLVPYSFWEKRPKTGGVSPADTSGVALSKNNVLWAADVAWSFRPGWRAWGEFLVDDISFSRDYKPDMIGYQAGMEWRQAVRDEGLLSVSAEYSRVHNYVYSVWNNHHFESQGLPFGFVHGPDVSYLAAETIYEHGAAWELGLRAEYREKGEGRLGQAWEKSQGKVDASRLSGIVERDVRLSSSVAYTPARWLRIVARAGTGRVENLDHVRSDGRESTTPLGLHTEITW